ncbi:hypothetical protein BSKO_05598 [Bryopsis sp. KO-2023]|nr:hypothetical protein BSKO_05598 [Bryopsis sp. KO-2023]
MANGERFADEPGQDDLRNPEFLMYSYKVKPCQKNFRHDWRVCPYAHERESAARRDPRLFKYVGVACPYAKQGKTCPRGQNCPCTHNVFEYWLHPTRFRTEICSQGTKCNRACCFFAHTESELRKLKHQDIINSAVGDPAETCDALESYLKKTKTCDLNAYEANEVEPKGEERGSTSHESEGEDVIIMASVPKSEVSHDTSSSCDEQERIAFEGPRGRKIIGGASNGMAPDYNQGEMLLCVDPGMASPVVPSPGAGAYLTSPDEIIDSNGNVHLLSPIHPHMQDVYMPPGEAAVIMGPDGHPQVINLADAYISDQGHFHHLNSRANLSPSPFDAVHLTGYQDIYDRSLTPQPQYGEPPELLQSEDQLTALQSDYERLSASWRINRGMSGPAMLAQGNLRNRSATHLTANQPSNGLGNFSDNLSATHLTNPSANRLGTTTPDVLAGGPNLQDEAALKNEYEKLSSSWGIHKGMSGPALLHASNQLGAAASLQNEFKALSGSWGLSRGVTNPAQSGMNRFSGLSGFRSDHRGLNGFSQAGMGYQSDHNLGGLAALQRQQAEDPIAELRRHLSPLPGIALGETQQMDGLGRPPLQPSDLDSLAALSQTPVPSSDIGNIPMLNQTLQQEGNPLSNVGASWGLTDSDIGHMTSSWGIGKSASTLSDSFALQGGESRRSSMGSRPPPGFATDRSSLDIAKQAAADGSGAGWLSSRFEGKQAGGGYMPMGKMVGRNWTFGGDNGRVM